MIKIERVLYWALYFKVIRSAAREVKKRQNELWWGKEGDAPQGVLKLPITLILLFCFTFSSCILLQPRTLKYAYKYECLECEMKDTLIYSNVLYYHQDTLIMLPSKKKIIITDVSFNKPPNNDRLTQTTNRRKGQDSSENNYLEGRNMGSKLTIKED